MKKFLGSLLVGAMLLVPSFVFAQGGDPLKTDKNVYAEPAPPPLPRAGETFVDPTFGTTILRVTDENDGPDSHNAYASWPSLNCNNTRLFYLSGSGNTGMICDFDANSFRIDNKRPLWQSPLPTGGYGWTEDAIWSATDPDVIYTHQGMRIWSYNVRTDTYTLCTDLTGRVPGAANLQQMSKSPDGVFGFNIQDANWQRLGCVAWNSMTNALYTYFGTMDEVQVDKTSRYLLIMTGEQGAGVIEGKVVDLQTGVVSDWTDNAPDFCPSHRDVGRGTVLGADNWNNQLTIRGLSTPHQFATALSFGNDWSQSNHISMLGTEDWGLLSTFAVSNNPPYAPFHNELFLVATDGSTNVRRVCHHHSDWLTTHDYWDSPRADLSMDGRFAVFTSNWGTVGRRDLFVVRIPPVGGYEAPPNPIYIETTSVPVRSSDGAAVTFVLSRAAKARVEYGVGGVFNQSASRDERLTNFTFVLTNLPYATTINWRIVTTDEQGRSQVSRTYYFSTFRTMVR